MVPASSRALALAISSAGLLAATCRMYASVLCCTCRASFWLRSAIPGPRAIR